MINSDKEDIIYTLTEEFIYSSLVESYEREYEKKGRFAIQENGLKLQVYNGRLLAFLTSKCVKVIIPERGSLWSGIEVIISGQDYLKDYEDGFRRGIKHFNEEYKIDLSTLYGPQGSEYVRTLHYKCFEEGLSGGWSSGLRMRPLSICHEGINEFGYNAGLFNQYEELESKHKPFFEKTLSINNENISETGPAIDPKDFPKPSLRQIALMYHFEGKNINELNKEEVANKCGYAGSTSGHKLLQHYKETATIEQRRMGKNAIKDLFATISFLAGNAKELAEGEYIVAKNRK